MAQHLELGIIQPGGRTAVVVETHRLSPDDGLPLQAISPGLLHHYQLCEALLYAWSLEYLKQTS